MVKLVILYQHPKDEDTFEEGYNNNLAQLEQMPGIIRRQANIVWGNQFGGSPYYRILEFYFEDRAALDTAMTSPIGQAAGISLMGYAGDLVELMFVDVFEE